MKAAIRSKLKDVLGDSVTEVYAYPAPPRAVMPFVEMQGPTNGTSYQHLSGTNTASRHEWELNIYAGTDGTATDIQKTLDSELVGGQETWGSTEIKGYRVLNSFDNTELEKNEHGTDTYRKTVELEVKYTR